MVEAGAGQAGTTQGQFAVLDLLGNLRDEAGGDPALAALQATCANAWQRMVTIVESGESYSAGDIAWLKELMTQITAQLPGTPAAAQRAQAAEAELPLNLNLAEDADLLREFINESREHLDNIEQGVLVLEKQPTERWRGISQFDPHQPARACVGIAPRPRAGGPIAH